MTVFGIARLGILAVTTGGVMGKNNSSSWPGGFVFCILAATSYSNTYAIDDDGALPNLETGVNVTLPSSAAGNSAQAALVKLYDAGIDALDHKDFQTAHNNLSKAAGQGYARAQSALAGMYLYGQGIPVDYAE